MSSQLAVLLLASYCSALDCATNADCAQETGKISCRIKVGSPTVNVAYFDADDATKGDLVAATQGVCTDMTAAVSTAGGNCDETTPLPCDATFYCPISGAKTCTALPIAEAACADGGLCGIGLSCYKVDSHVATADTSVNGICNEHATADGACGDKGPFCVLDNYSCVNPESGTFDEETPANNKCTADSSEPIECSADTDCADETGTSCMIKVGSDTTAVAYFAVGDAAKGDLVEDGTALCTDMTAAVGTGVGCEEETPTPCDATFYCPIDGAKTCTDLPLAEAACAEEGLCGIGLSCYVVDGDSHVATPDTSINGICNEHATADGACGDKGPFCVLDNYSCVDPETMEFDAETPANNMCTSTGDAPEGAFSLAAALMTTAIAAFAF